MKRYLYILYIVVSTLNASAADTLTVKQNVQESAISADSLINYDLNGATEVSTDDIIYLDSMETEMTIGDIIDGKSAQKTTDDFKKSTFIPSPKKAMWLGIVLPGAGQIYNRKFWKLPIIYGGMVGCIYAMRWNNNMYTDYSRAYLDLMDDDPNTQSYNSFMHLGAQINDSNKSRYENIFKRRKDYYRRYRDLSIFCMIGVYAISIIDAYVDASLSQFDISRDLSLRVEPTVIRNQSSSNPISGSSLGVNIGLTF